LATENIVYTEETTRFSFQKKENVFSLSKNVIQNADYQIITSNRRVKDHEN
jgi:hypothetical protein